MNTRSLRFRLIVWYAVWLSLVFVAFGAIIYLASKGFLEATLRESLSRRARQIGELLQDVSPADRRQVAAQIETHFAPEANNRFVRVTGPAGAELYRSGAPRDASFDPEIIVPPDGSIVRESLAMIETPDGRALFVVARPVRVSTSKYIVEVGSSATPEKTTLHHVLVAFAIALPILIAVAVAGGFLLVQRSLQPVDEIIAAAERISSHNLGERLPVSATGDELERLSLALNNMIRRLDEAFQHNTRFMADSSHELRTPLAIMQAELEDALRNQPANPEVARVAGAMLEEVQRLAGIVAGLFAISRFDAGEAQQEFVRVDLAQLVASTTEQMALLADDKQLKLACSASSPVYVLADRAGLRQVTVNLLDNAIKYTLEGGSIDVRVHAHGTKAVLEVADTGIGIPAGALPRVFDRFFRVDKARSREMGGAGLGLSIVKAICGAHNGTVRVSSEEGRGSRFIVELPLAE